MNVDLGIWGKLIRTMTVLLFVAFTVGVVVWYLPLIRKNEKMRQEILRLESEIKVERDRVREQELAIETLRNDPEAVERVAREKLGYARAGETVIVFEESLTNGIPRNP